MEYIDIVVYMLMIGIKIYVFSVILKGFLYIKEKKEKWINYDIYLFYISFILIK